MRKHTWIALLEPYKKLMACALLATMLESVAALLGPLPLKLVFDSVLDKRRVPRWVEWFAGTDAMRVR